MNITLPGNIYSFFVYYGILFTEKQFFLLFYSILVTISNKKRSRRKLIQKITRDSHWFASKL